MTTYFPETGAPKVEAIVALDQAFRNDAHPGKVNLVVGVYRNQAGVTPVLDCVKQAEARLVAGESSKAYLPSAGDPAFVAAAEQLVFGPDHARLRAGEICSFQAPGSTGALRIAGEFVANKMPQATVWLSTPAYSNHEPLFRACGLAIRHHRYYDAPSGTLVFEDMLADLEQARPGDVVVLHAVCHNPTGVDLNLDQWRRLARFMAERKLLPLIDSAYLGIGGAIDEDAVGIRAMAETCPEVFVATSFSKNFALYSERVGLLSVVASSAAAGAVARDHLTVIVRSLYTASPSHGARAAQTILADSQLRALWLTELEAMRNRMKDMRNLFADLLDQHQVSAAFFPNIRNNRGMFALSTLGKDHIARLREDHHIYMLDSGRVSVAGMQEKDLPAVCQAIADVTKR